LIQTSVRGPTKIEAQDVPDVDYRVGAAGSQRTAIWPKREAGHGAGVAGEARAVQPGAHFPEVNQLLRFPEASILPSAEKARHAGAAWSSGKDLTSLPVAICHK